MTDPSSIPAGQERDPIEIDKDVAHPARIYNYLLGGEDNFAADRKAAEKLYGSRPGGSDAARALIRAGVEFMARAVRYMVEQSGVRQFLNIGTVILPTDNVHDVAQRAAPESRVVYVIRDPVVLAQAHRLLNSSPEGVSAYIHGDLRNPADLMQQVGATLDLDRPIAVLLLGTLNYIPDARNPHGILAELLEHIPSGSYVAISHIANDLRRHRTSVTAKRRADLARSMSLPFVRRSQAEIVRFFMGLELVEPGVVEINHWRRPPEGPTQCTGRSIPAYVGVGRKP